MKVLKIVFKVKQQGSVPRQNALTEKKPEKYSRSIVLK